MNRHTTVPFSRFLLPYLSDYRPHCWEILNEWILAAICLKDYPETALAVAVESKATAPRPSILCPVATGCMERGSPGSGITLRHSLDTLQTDAS